MPAILCRLPARLILDRVLYTEGHIMEFVWFIVVGLVAGWLAGVLMKGGGFGVIGDIVVGIIGAFIGGWLISPLIGGGTINQGDFSVMSLVSALIAGCWMAASPRHRLLEQAALSSAS